MNQYLPRITAIALLLGTLAHAGAPADQGVVADLAVAKVTEKAGKQAFESARDAAPGDVVEYRVTYRNTTYARAHGVIGTLSIPANRLTYVPDTATRGFLLEASLDGKAFEPVPLRRPALQADGSLKMEAIPATEYRYLRWQLGDLPGRASVTVSARMRIETTSKVALVN